MNEENRIEIEFTQGAYDKVRQLNTIADNTEWSAFLIGETGSFKIRITDLYIPYQEVTESTADVDTDKLGEWVAWMSEHRPEDLTKVRGMIHGHVNMNTFYSYVDTDTNNEYTQNLGVGKSFVSIVVNRRMDFIATVMIKLGDGFSFELKDVDVTVEHGDVPVSPELRKTFKERVKVRTYAYSGTWDDDGDMPTFTVLDKKHLEQIEKMYYKNRSIKKAMSEIKSWHLSKEETADALRIAGKFFGNSMFSTFQLMGLRKIDKRDYRKALKMEKKRKKRADKLTVVDDDDRRDFGPTCGWRYPNDYGGY